MSKKILILEDETITLELLRDIMIGQGFDVALAANGREGLNRVRDFQPDIILADILMPEMDGFAFYKELKLDKKQGNVPIIILTVRAKMEDTFRMLGVESFLIKPFDTDNLLSEINRLTGGLQPSESTSRAKPAGRPIEFNAGGVILSPGHKVLLFGSDAPTLESLSKQLREEKCSIDVVQEEISLLARLKSFEPEIVMVQINSDVETPIDDIISTIRHDLDQFVKNRSSGNQKAGQPQRPIILFKVQEELTGVSSLAGSIVDTESVLQRCFANGATEYIGAYSTRTFRSRIQPFLMGQSSTMKGR